MFYVIPFCLLVAVGADEDLLPLTRLENVGEVETASLSADGKRLFGVVRQGMLVDVAVWDIASGKKTVLMKAVDLVNIVPSPDGTTVLGIVEGSHQEDRKDQDELILGDVVNMSSRTLLKGAETCRGEGCTFSLNGSVLSLADGNTNTVHLWRRGAEGKWGVDSVLHVCTDAPKPNLLTTRFAPDGKHVYVSFGLSSEKTPQEWGIEKWDIATGRKTPFRIQPIKSEMMFGPMVFSADGKTFCVMTSEGVIGVDALSGKRLYTIDSGLSIPFVSPDGRIGAAISPSMATNVTPRKVTFWNYIDGTQHGRVELPGTAAPVGAFTADSRLFVVPEEGGAIRVIDVGKGDTRPSQRVSGPVKGLRLLSSGEIAAVGVEPKAIVIWKIKMP